MALLWGVLICLTAIQYVGTDAGQAGDNASAANPDLATDATGQPITAQDVATVQHAFAP